MWYYRAQIWGRYVDGSGRTTRVSITRSPNETVATEWSGRQLGFRYEKVSIRTRTMMQYDDPSVYLLIEGSK